MKRKWVIMAGLLAAQGAFAIHYEITVQPTEQSVSCRPNFAEGSSQENYLSISIPTKEVEARLQNHALQATVKSEFECQKLRIHLVEGGPLKLDVNRETETRYREETERHCRFVGGGGHDGGRYVCSYVRVGRSYLEESLEAEILGMKFTSFHSMRL